MINHTALLYDLPSICINLSMNLNDFKTLCILSGTDYNIANHNIFYFYKLFQIYNQCQNTNFLEWLCGKYISLQQYLHIQDITKIYNIHEQNILSKEKYKRIYNGEIDKYSLKNILQSDGFIFV